MLIIRNFRKQYGDTVILTIPQLTLTTGAYWFKGENGSGKSTFFRSLSGLIPFDGEVQFDDGPSLHNHPVKYRERVNYSEAEPLYPSFLTPVELMRFVGKAKGATRDQQQVLFERFGITSFQHKPCGSCSSGMIKKVSLALAFLGSPQVIILDEPMITLDEKSRNILSDLVSEYIKDHQIICLLSSHQVLDENFISLQGSFLVKDRTITAL